MSHKAPLRPVARRQRRWTSTRWTTAAAWRLRAINLGGIVTALQCPDRDGRSANVVLGFGMLDDYVERNPNFGTLVGRYANRIARRALRARRRDVPVAR